MKKKTLALVTAFAMTGVLPGAYAEDSTKELVEHVHKMAVKYQRQRKSMWWMSILVPKSATHTAG